MRRINKQTRTWGDEENRDTQSGQMKNTTGYKRMKRDEREYTISDNKKLEEEGAIERQVLKSVSSSLYLC